ncbi:hypothetical protein L0128_11600 [candidate division KSB1 bacterium]|nr:hypothetical protein [candidate division KSB1 bacterium]
MITYRVWLPIKAIRIKKQEVARILARNQQLAGMRDLDAYFAAKSLAEVAENNPEAAACPVQNFTGAWFKWPAPVNGCQRSSGF